MPEAMQSLQWQDKWNEGRNQQALARDYAYCTTIVESRRSQLPSCMESRGWIIPK